MKLFFDINTHILPFVEDGAESFQMTKELLEVAVANNTHYIIASPHRKHVNRKTSIHEIKSSYITVKRYMEEVGIPIKLYLGNEIEYDSATLDKLKSGELLTLANTTYVLVSFYKSVEYSYIKRAVHTLVREGYHPIIAHVEQYTSLQNIDDIFILKEMGAYFQLDESSLHGGFWCKNRKHAKELLKYRLVDFIVSNSHIIHKNSTNISKHRDWIEKKYGESYADKIYCDNGLLLLENKEIGLIHFEVKEKIGLA
ncbi:MAG: CpsB/CapC family capsule biosynthesis tyrosine phosphatase [Eubacteriales bacterium]